MCLLQEPLHHSLRYPLTAGTATPTLRDWGGVILGETDLIQVRQRGWENRVASENSVYKDPSTAFRVWIPTTHRGVLHLERCKDDRNGWESLVTRILDQRDGEILSSAKKRKSPIRLRKSGWSARNREGGP